MRARLATIFRLGIKELRSLRADPVMLFLVLYTFTIAIYTVATGSRFDVHDAAVAVVDEDRSALSRAIADAIRPPQFKPPVEIAAHEIDEAMDNGRYVFVIDIPPRFEADVLAGRRPDLQINVDATAMTQAGNGLAYLRGVLSDTVGDRLRRDGPAPDDAVTVITRARFNPNLASEWFTPVMQVINNITILTVILTGAAFIREREHGTIEHLLVMPVRPIDIMLSKIWANGMVIVIASVLSLLIVVQGVLEVPLAGSLLLFIATTILYEFAIATMGLLIATFTASMPQFGLLALPILIVMNLLSGSSTPMESMPDWLNWGMQISPSVHFVAAVQAILYRGAGLDVVWKPLVILAAIGAFYFAVAAARFRATLSTLRG
ncbi:ABC transporter permease [Zavarzinia compransoris]|uniref:ABC transporter permease n=1 Tax=Zavarzinia marina TaxID=2911065 RepID=UPI001F2E7D6B|nr:ABC transporter permease [Zavarzinia marina]MCF4164145.1 ABC transporter permease [Zavarzinia marina]